MSDVKNLHDENLAFAFREAADKVWDMAKEYKAMGLDDLADLLIEMADKLHDEARKVEKKLN